MLSGDDGLLRPVLGICCLVLAWLLRESEEKAIVVFFERLWCTVDKAVAAGVSIQVALSAEMSRVTERAIEWVLGPRLLSLRGVWTSLIASLTSVVVLVWIHLLMTPEGMLQPAASSQVHVVFRWGVFPCIIAVLVGVALLPRFVSGSELPLLAVPAYGFIRLVAAYWSRWAALAWVMAFGALLIAAVASALFTLALLRRALRWSRGSPHVVRLVATTVVGVGIVLALVPGPMWLEGKAIFLWGRLWDVQAHQLEPMFRGNPALVAPLLVPPLLALANALTAFFVIWYVFILLFALGYRVLAPVLERFFYAIKRHGFYPTFRKALGAVGVALLVGPWAVGFVK